MLWCVDQNFKQRKKNEEWWPCWPSHHHHYLASLSLSPSFFSLYSLKPPAWWTMFWSQTRPSLPSFHFLTLHTTITCVCMQFGIMWSREKLERRDGRG
jgi:hypothetical protein